MRSHLLLAACAAVLTACAPPAPAAAPATSGPSTSAAFTPELIARTRQMMDREYPRLLRDAGVDGEVVARFTIREDGRAGDVQLVETTQEMFSAAATRIVRRLEFPSAAAAGRVGTLRAEVVLRFRANGAHEVVFRPL